MTAQKKDCNTPRLRFKDVNKTDYPAWKIKPLEYLGNFIGGGTPSTKEKNYWNGSIPWISSSDLQKNDIHNISITRYITEYAIHNSSTQIIPKGAVVIVLRVGVGKLALAPCELCTSQDFLSLVDCKDNNLFLGYILSYLMNVQAYKVQGTAIKGITSKEIKKLQISLPSVIEQKKIADFLSTIDEKIEVKHKHVNALELAKTGIIQKIFKQEFRFKDSNGKDYPKWKNKSLSDTCIVTMGQSPSSFSYNENFDGVPLIQGKADICNRESFPQKYTTAPTKMCSKGSIILSVRAPVGFVAKSMHDACIGRGICGINTISSPIDYVYYYLLSIENKWKAIGQGSTFAAISGENIRKLRLPFPSMEEQQKISDLLSAFDEKIEIEKKLLESLEILKKGFMQQIFPDPLI